MTNLLFIMALLFAVMPVQAHLHGNEEQDKPFNFKSPDDITTFQAIEHEEEYYGCSGYVRTGYIETEHVYATAFAGELGCSYQLNQYVKVHLGVFASVDTGINSQNDDNIHADFFNNKKDSYLILGEAVLTLSYQQFEAYLGRQNLDSPHMDADDLRMIANLFEAYLLEYHFSDAFYFGAGFVREAAGWENGANASQFVSIVEALGGGSDGGGAWLSWLNYQQQHYSSDSWFYFIPDHLAIFYTEFNYNNVLSDNLSYTLSLQYDLGQAIGAEKLGNVDAHTLGVMAALSWADLTFTAAYNKNLGNSSALASIGGGPYFTSLEDQTLDAVSGDKSESILLSLEYELGEYLTLGTAVGKFNAANKTDYNKEEINFFINYSWKQKLTAEVMYAIIDDKNSEPDVQQIRTILTYRY